MSLNYSQNLTRDHSIITLRRSSKINENRYESFADARSGCDAKCFINAKDFFADLFESLTHAKKSIYFCGLCFAPELFLIRPVSEEINFQTRLMDILEAKAKENVIIKILVYREVPYTLPLDSEHTKTLLNSLHPNIMVRRYPRQSFPYHIYANHEKTIVIDQEIAYVGGIDLFWGRYETNEFSIKEESNSQKLYNWPGIDFSNDKLTDRYVVKKYLQEFIDRDTTPRMPWHDVSCRLKGPVVIDVFRHFYQRWCYAIDKKGRHPISFDDYVQTADPKMLSKLYNRGKMTCQLVRSASKWSTGNPIVESSIINAYIDLIENSQHYIMINNQFFISNSYSEEGSKHKVNSKIVNDVALHLVNRIKRAYIRREKFRVYVFIPLLPGFAGKVSKTQALQTIIKYTYRTISKHKGLSVIEQLIEFMGGKYQEYIYFFSLRNHAAIHGIPKTELIYIHAKTMIVDDESVIIGSANLNDRSLLGDRDSEVCVVIRTSQDRINSVIDGLPTTVSKFAFDMRVTMMKMYLGLTNENSNNLGDNVDRIFVDPLSDELFNYLVSQARKNTLIYREIFKCVPDDIFLTFDDLKYSFSDNCLKCIELLTNKYSQYKDQIKGVIVEFPLNFLRKEDLSRKVFTKERIVPIDIFI